MVWVSELQGSKDIYIGMFNIADSAHEVLLDFNAIGIAGNAKLRDLWNQKDIGIIKTQFSNTIRAHGCMLLRVAAQ